jgi:hypothetical protein
MAATPVSSAVPVSPEPLPQPARPAWLATVWLRSVAGFRLSALVEVGAFLLLALAADAWLGQGDRFANLSPHPFWIPVLLASAYYGSREGLLAAALSATALMAGRVPEQQVGEDVYVWLLRTTLPVIAWCFTAVVLGGIRDALRRRHEALLRELREAREQAATITDAFRQLDHVNQQLEARIAGQLCTVHAMYDAARAIERQDVGDVLSGIVDMVRAVMNPGQFSLFLLNGDKLEAAASEGWQAHDRHAREIGAASPLFHAIVSEGQVLVAANPKHEPLLGDEGLLAGPLVNHGTGQVVGMLKIERLEFIDLHAAGVQTFHLLCDWIGAALAKAQHVEEIRQAGTPAPGAAMPLADPRKVPAKLLVQLARRIGFDLSALLLAASGVKEQAPPGDARVGLAVQRAAEHLLGSEALAFEHHREGWSHAVLMPGILPEQMPLITRRLVEYVERELLQSGQPVSLRHQMVALHAVEEARA